MRKCECGTEVNYDGYDDIKIQEGFFEIRGDAKCPNCGREYRYIECHTCDFDNPFSVELEEEEM